MPLGAFSQKKCGPVLSLYRHIKWGVWPNSPKLTSVDWAAGSDAPVKYDSGFVASRREKSSSGAVGKSWSTRMAGSAIELSASDLSSFLSCIHLTALDLAMTQG